MTDFEFGVHFYSNFVHSISFSTFLMKKHVLTLAVLLLFCLTAFSKPLFTKSKYLIACLANGSTGTVSPGNVEYNLAFFPDRDSENATDSDYWVIKDLGAGQFAFQNASTLKFIKYKPDTVDRWALRLVDALQTDGSTSWTFETKTYNNLSYYVIRSVFNTAKVWNKRATNFGGLYPVGTYAETGAMLEYFLFYGMDGNAVMDDGGINITMPTVKPTLGAFAGQLDSLSFGEKVPAVDTAKKGFYLTMPDSQLEGTDITLPVFYKPKNMAYQLYIGGIQVTSGVDFTFTRVTGTSSFGIEIRNGTTVLASGTVYFSGLPLVQLYSNTTLTATYTLGRITVTEPDKPGSAEYLLSDLKTRGALAASLVKKAFSVKLKDANGLTAMDRSFFGLRNDNNWLLDAMGIDLARMRNRVSTDLWNDYSVKPYWVAQEPNMVNGTRGHYVEVFVNDSYNGLYCMTEKVDRKQLYLKKYEPATENTPVVQHGALFKVDEWSFESQMGNTSTSYYYDGKVIGAYNNSVERWCNYDCKYPDVGDSEPIEWKNMYNAVTTCSDFTTYPEFYPNVQVLFDLPEVRDYYLLIELALAADNQGKNMYFSIYDQSVSPKMSITPWDMDATWGRRWDGSSEVTGPNQNFDAFVTKYEHGQSNLFLRLKFANVAGFNDMLKSRYKELRGSYFSYNSLYGRFNTYQVLLKKSGALNREILRWTGSPRVSPDSNFDLAFLSTWITSRLSYLDTQYLGGPYAGLDDTKHPHIEVSPNPVRDFVAVHNLQAGTHVQILNIQGTVVRKEISEGEQLTIDMSSCAPGIYLVHAGSWTFKVIKQ